jgi:hypothetical protein
VLSQRPTVATSKFLQVILFPSHRPIIKTTRLEIYWPFLSILNLQTCCSLLNIFINLYVNPFRVYICLLSVCDTYIGLLEAAYVTFPIRRYTASLNNWTFKQQFPLRISAGAVVQIWRRDCTPLTRGLTLLRNYISCSSSAQRGTQNCFITPCSTTIVEMCPSHAMILPQWNAVNRP